MEKEYVRIQWENRPSITTPLGQINLNKMDYQIDKNENTLITFDTTKANQSDLLQTIRTLTYDTETGIFVFTFWNGSTYSVDLNIEKIPVTFSMDEYGVITMTTADGTTYTCDIGALIKLYTFVDGDEIDFVTTTDAGGNKTITASIKDGSIVGSKLQPNFLADCQAAKAQAELAATSASSDASDAELSSEDSEAWAVGERNGQPVPSTDPAYENNAKWWAQHGTGSSFAGLTDTNFTNLQNGQIAKYNSTTQKWENTEDEGGLLPHFKITSEAGSTVTVVCPDTSVITPTQTSSGIWQCDVPAYGVYTVHAVINGDDAVRSVTVDTVKEYVIHDEHYSYTLNVYAPTGSSILVTDGGSETYTGTGAGSTAVIFALHQASTTYTITVDYDGLDIDTTITSSATSGGSGSKTIEFGTINLTLDEDLIGETIVMAKGTDTVSKVASSTSMVFYPNATGNWTISCQYDGETYYSEPNPVVVSSLSTPVSAELSLVKIPEGATVTPTDDIQIWLACANITDKSYTTLAEVLADRETFETLIADSNACDYMARSTSWAGNASVKVPTMTSDSQPSGNAICGSYYTSSGTWNAYRAFDKDVSTRWNNNQTMQNDYIGYRFTTPVCINKITITPFSDQLKECKVQGSNTGNSDDWHDLSDVITLPNGTIESEIKFDNKNEYSYYVVRCLINHRPNRPYNFSICEIQFTYEGITTSQDAMALIGRYDYCSNALLGNATWAEAIANSDYRDSVASPLVPKMTSNTTPSGEAFESNGYGGAQYAPWRAFDEDISTIWASYQAVENSAVGYKSTSKVVAYFFDFAWSGSSAYLPPKIQIQGSNDNFVNDINVLGEYTGSDYPTTETKYRLFLESFGSYQYHRCAIIEKGSIPNFQVAELQFYGRASSEVLVPLVPTMSSNTTPSGEVKSNAATYSGYPAYQAFDGNDNTAVYWTQTDNPYIEYDFASGHSYIVKRFLIYPAYIPSVGLYAKDYKIEASNDGETWTTLYTGTFTNSNVGKVYIDIENNTAYSKYRLYFTSETYANGKNWQIHELQFYAKTVQTNIIHSAANDTIYMLEDGDPIVLATTNSDGDGILDFSQLSAGPVTLYSSVAKNPEDLTADYSKTITITKTQYGGTTEAYLIPDTIKTPYWWGYESNAMIAIASGATDMSQAAPTITNNTNNKLLSQTKTSRGCGYYKTLSEDTDLHVIYSATAGQAYAYNSIYVAMSNTNNKIESGVTNIELLRNASSVSLNHKHETMANRNYIVFQLTADNANVALTINALWLEHGDAI